MEPAEYDDIIRNLVRIAVHQDTINERLTTAIERLDGTTARLEDTTARIDMTLAAIKDLLQRWQNGR